MLLREELLLNKLEPKQFTFYINVACSLDTIIGSPYKQEIISNIHDWKVVHNLRNESVAIVVGSNTILIDNPTLLTKDQYIENEEVHHPVRVVIDRRGRLTGRENIFQSLDRAPLVIIGNNDKNNLDIEHQNLYCIDVQDTIQSTIILGLKKFGINSGFIMIEGGATTITNFLKEGNIARLRIFRSTKFLIKGIRLFQEDIPINFKLLSVKKLGDGIQEVYQPVLEYSP